MEPNLAAFQLHGLQHSAPNINVFHTSPISLPLHLGRYPGRKSNAIGLATLVPVNSNQATVSWRLTLSSAARGLLVIIGDLPCNMEAVKGPLDRKKTLEQEKKPLGQKNRKTSLGYRKRSTVDIKGANISPQVDQSPGAPFHSKQLDQENQVVFKNHVRNTANKQENGKAAARSFFH